MNLYVCKIRAAENMFTKLREDFELFYDGCNSAFITYRFGINENLWSIFMFLGKVVEQIN